MTVPIPMTSDAEVDAAIRDAFDGGLDFRPTRGWCVTRIDRVLYRAAYRAGRSAGTGEPIAWIDEQGLSELQEDGLATVSKVRAQYVRQPEPRQFALYAAPVPPMVKETALGNTVGAPSEAAARYGATK